MSWLRTRTRADFKLPYSAAAVSRKSNKCRKAQADFAAQNYPAPRVMQLASGTAFAPLPMRSEIPKRAHWLPAVKKENGRSCESNPG